jgi:hypothetical protein
MVGGKITLSAATPEPDVQLSLHPGSSVYGQL